jgi:hypothetical protein
MSDWCLNSLELSPENGIFVTKAIPFAPSVKYDSTSAWMGTKVRVTGIQPSPVKISLQGLCTTQTALRSLTKYDAGTYNWNQDPEKLYLIRDLTRRWKIYSMEVDTTFDKDDYPFVITIITDKLAAEGIVQTSKTGTAIFSSTSVFDLVNAGDQDTYLESIKITGSYSGGLNLTGAKITQSLIDYSLNVAGTLLDTAYITFYDDFIAEHVYIDDLSSTYPFLRNTYSSVNVVYSTGELQIGNGGTLEYKFDLTHPLSMDPILTLSLSYLIGSPKLEVSWDGISWWETEKSLVAGNFVSYNLTRLAGSSLFYFRITTGAAVSLSVNYIKLHSWHKYSGQRPIPYLRANSVAEEFEISFTGGSLVYDFKYRDKWSI